MAEFNASYSNAASLDASSLRIDQRLNNKLSLFRAVQLFPVRNQFARKWPRFERNTVIQNYHGHSHGRSYMGRFSSPNG